MIRSLTRPSVSILTAVLLLLVVSTVAILVLTSREPVVEALEPNTASDGDVVTVAGRHFGDTRGTSYVTVAGRRLTSSNYLEWNDDSIVIRIPGFSESGLVEVHTSQGQSEGMLLRHTDGLPHAHGEGRVSPELHGIVQDEVSVGDRLVIRGENLGQRRGSFEVSFEGNNGARVLPPASREHYPYWSPEEIHVLVPSGAADGTVRLEREGFSVDLGTIAVNRVGGTKTNGPGRTSIIERGVRLQDKSGDDDGSVIGLWIPAHTDRTFQRRPDVLSHNAPEPVRVDDSMLFFRWEPSRSEGAASGGVRWNEQYTRHTITTDLSSGDVRSGYNTGHPVYSRYTRAVEGLAVEDEDVSSAAAAGRGGDPFSTVENIWNWMSGTFEWSNEAADDPVEVLDTLQGNASGLTDLFVSMLRAEGIPARPVRGVLVTNPGELPWYSWAEFYLDGFGWVPADIARTVGAGISYFGEDAPEITREPALGELDNRVIEFRAGVPRTPSIWPSSRRSRNAGPYAAHGITTELLRATVGGVEWQPVVLLGMLEND